jgi:hypothetical protein
VVLANEATVGDKDGLARGARTLGAELVLAPVAVDDGSPRHDPGRLAVAFREVLSARPDEVGAVEQTSSRSSDESTTSQIISSTGGHRAWR